MDPGTKILEIAVKIGNDQQYKICLKFSNLTSMAQI